MNNHDTRSTLEPELHELRNRNEVLEMRVSAVSKTLDDTLIQLKAVRQDRKNMSDRIIQLLAERERLPVKTESKKRDYIRYAVCLLVGAVIGWLV